MQPLIPFEPTISQHIPTGKEWISQVKWDGVRMLMYCNNGKIKLFNRNLNEKTAQYPELTNYQTFSQSSTFIIDGEIISLKSGVPSFQQVMKRDRLQNESTIHQSIYTIPIIYMVFDILQIDEQTTMDFPLAKRQQLLSDMILENDSVQVVENFSDGEKLFAAIKQQGLEGIVCKDKTKSYIINGKDNRWMKVKNYRDLIAIVGGYVCKGGMLSSLVLGLYQSNGTILSIGRVGRGMYSQKDWKTIEQFLQSQVSHTNPFSNLLTKPGYVWTTPNITVKVRFLEWTESNTLRQPLLESVVNIAPEQCTLMKYRGLEIS